MFNTSKVDAWQEILALSLRVGSVTPAWCQGAGGNVSVKDSSSGQETLLIKASGYRLDRVSKAEGIVPVNLKALRAKIETSFLDPQLPQGSNSGNADLDYDNLIEVLFPTNRGQRPSMEVGFHSLLPGRLVVHIHSLAALLIAHQSSRNPLILSGIANDSGLKISLIPVVSPGLELLQSVAKDRNADVYIMANHGVILQGDDDSILSRWSDLERDFCRRSGYLQLLGELENPGSFILKSGDTPTPMRFYFPDTAVFHRRLLDNLEPLPSPNSSQSDTATNDELYRFVGNNQNACEIWTAQQILYSECPDLAEIPPQIIARVTGLPAENFRLRHAK